MMYQRPHTDSFQKVTHISQSLEVINIAQVRLRRCEDKLFDLRYADLGCVLFVMDVKPDTRGAKKLTDSLAIILTKKTC